MKLDISASWGYPVLRSGSDDYVNCELQSELVLRASPENMDVVEVDYFLDFSVPELKEMVANGLARCVLYVHCRTTWYEEAFELPGLAGVIELKKELIEGDTNFWTLIIANGRIEKYQSVKFNAEYEGETFEIQPQQIFAIADPEAQHISRDFFKSVTSLFDYNVNNNLPEGYWTVSLDDNRVMITANDTQLGCFRAAENTDASKAVLLNSVFLPVTQFCVAELLNSQENYEDFKWASVFKAKMEDIAEKNDSLLIAQKLLRNPTTWLNKHMKWKDDEA